MNRGGSRRREWPSPMHGCSHVKSEQQRKCYRKAVGQALAAPCEIIFKALFIPVSGRKHNRDLQGGCLSLEELSKQWSKLSARGAPMGAAIHRHIFAACDSGAGWYFSTNSGNKIIANEGLHGQGLFR